MAQRITAWVLSHAIGFISSPSRTVPQTRSNDQPGTKTVRPSQLPTSYLHVLPAEIHHEILKYLEWRDIINASLICRAWYRATHSRQLWLALVKRLELTPGIGKMEESVGDYTTAELRQWVLMRLRAQEPWDMENIPLTFNQREIELPKMTGIKLLPGGKWLLVSDAEGKLYSYDLDFSKCRLLIDPGQDEESSSILQQFSYWIDSSNRKLSLRVAMWDYLPPTGQGNPRTCIYELNLLGHGEDSFFEAILLTVLRDGEQAWKRAVALTGKYLVESQLPDSGTATLSVLQYMYDNNTVSEGTRIQMRLIPSLSAFELYITPGEHIIMMGFNCIHVYSIHQFLVDNVSEAADLVPLHAIPCDNALCCCAPPTYSQNYVELVYGHEDVINLARISPEDSEPITIIRLGEQNLYNNSTKVSSIFSPAAAILLHTSWTMEVATYSWDVAMNSEFSAKRISIPKPNIITRLLPVGMEKGLGRIILATFSAGRCVVLDTV